MTRLVLRLRSIAMIAVLAVAACEPGSDLPKLPDTSPGPYRLGVGDRIRVVTFGDTSLTGEFRVNDRGNIAVPLLGNLKASGLTTVELEQRFVTDLEQRKILSHPSVAVEILAYRPIFILGEVAKPGQYPYEPDMTVLTAVAIAGGVHLQSADQDRVDPASRKRAIDRRTGRPRYGSLSRRHRRHLAALFLTGVTPLPAVSFAANEDLCQRAKWRATVARSWR